VLAKPLCMKKNPRLRAVDGIHDTSNRTPREFSSGRLALYLAASWNTDDRERITSHEIGRATGVNATQVRRDLSRVFGRIGKRGAGYPVAALSAVLEKTLSANVREVEAITVATRQRAEQLEQVLAALRDGDSRGAGTASANAADR
jgi:adenosyl cobinamide kinase/adenosyl cobinamide phosphate guanylyltransferase